MKVEFSIKKLDYRKWWTELREYFGSQVVTHGWQRTSQSKADRSVLADFHRQYPNCENYFIIFEVEDGR